MMSLRAISMPNIALIKYWGNRNDELRLPAADSLSMTLDYPLIEVMVKDAERFSARSFEPDGIAKVLTLQETTRLEKHFLLGKKYLQSINAAQEFPASVSLEIRSNIPQGIGLASSSAVFSALAEAYAGFANGVSRRDVSILARLGSGSASRSVFGGFAAMSAGEGGGVDASYAEQIAPEHHWTLHDIIIAPTHKEKVVGSTEGHALAHTSPLFEARLQEIPRRQKMCIEAIQTRDFEKLREVSEEDCLNMHEVMRSSTPSLDYLSGETHRLIQEVKELRAREHLSVLYTMDAGPTVHLLCEQSALPSIRAFAHAQEGCSVFEAGIGSGSRIL